MDRSTLGDGLTPVVALPRTLDLAHYLSARAVGAILAAQAAANVRHMTFYGRRAGRSSSCAANIFEENCFPSIREIGEPEYPRRSQVEQLGVASRLEKEPLDFSYEKRTVRFDVDLRPHSVAAVTRELAPEPSDGGAGA